MLFASMGDPRLTEDEMIMVGEGSDGAKSLTDFEMISALNSNPTLLPWDHIRHFVFPGILATATSLVVVQQILLLVVRAIQKRKKGTKNIEKAKETLLHWQMSYQFTNLLMNLFLGLLGIYHWFFTLPSTSPITERIEGWESLSIFASVQLGYQFWSLPMGIFFVDESVPMLVHHIAVCVVTSLSGFFTNGFRYNNAFFYGLIEISSVPLAVMNSFKKNPNWIQDMPRAYTVVRLVFAASFLIARVIMWLPEIVDFLWLASMLMLTMDDWIGKIATGATMTASSFLTGLQLFWATKIIRGVLDIVLENKKVCAGEVTKQE